MRIDHPLDSRSQNLIQLQELAMEYQVETLLRTESWQNPSYLRTHELLDSLKQPILRDSFVE